MSGLFQDTITIERIGAENADGVARTTTHTVRGAYVELTAAQRRNVQGATDADTALVALEPQGYGAAWGIAVGDRLTALGTTILVTDVAVIRNPRTRTIHHIEVRGG